MLTAKENLRDIPGTSDGVTVTYSTAEMLDAVRMGQLDMIAAAIAELEGAKDLEAAGMRILTLAIKSHS